MKKSKAISMEAKDGASPSQLIDAGSRTWATGGARRSRGSGYHQEADPEVVEEWKWRGVPVWEHDGIICTGETYKAS